MLEENTQNPTPNQANSEPTLEEMERQIAELTRKANDLRQAERNKAIAQIRQLMSKHGLDISDIGQAGTAKRAGSGNKVAPKYRNPETGETWTGRGRAPLGLDGKNKDDYLIPA